MTKIREYSVGSLRYAGVVVFGAATMVAATAVASATPAVGPSFNCAAPAVINQPLAQLICSSDRIARAEFSYVIAYMALRQISNDTEQATMRAEAQAFTARITEECGIPRTGKLSRVAFEKEVNCLVGKFDTERGRLFVSLQGDAVEEAGLSPEQTIAIQRVLKEKGFLASHEPLDGVFGPATREAIGSFQRSIGARATGMGSAVLLEQLQGGSSVPSIVAPPAVAPPSAPPVAQVAGGSAGACKDNWTKCSSNEQLVDEWDGWIKVRQACRGAVNDKVSFGKPEWHWPGFFDRFQKSDGKGNSNSYVTTGEAVAVDGDVQIQNQFGAMVHVKAYCTYNLRAGKITDAFWIER